MDESLKETTLDELFGFAAHDERILQDFDNDLHSFLTNKSTGDPMFASNKAASMMPMNKLEKLDSLPLFQSANTPFVSKQQEAQLFNLTQKTPVPNASNAEQAGETASHNEQQEAGPQQKRKQRRKTSNAAPAPVEQHVAPMEESADAEEDEYDELSYEPGGGVKEDKRVRRLMRNRVSAQLARERKKAYVASLEATSGASMERCRMLEQRLQVLETENALLKQIIHQRIAPPSVSK